ncbi:MAG: DNA helicase RecG, partial [Firmicutes bacterium]|nr:DNA helicase RecG [Bacillota bacterium]
YLAEKDLQIRGPGDLTGVRQSGLPEFRIADLLRDQPLLLAARRRAEELLQKDPALQTEENRPLREYLLRLQQSRQEYYHIS